MSEPNSEIAPEMHPVETSNEPIHKVDFVVLAKLDELLSAQIPVTIELPDGTKMPYEEYDEDTLRDSKLSLLADDDGDKERPKTRAALEKLAAEGTIQASELDAIMDQLESMGGLTDASVLTNVCKSDWGEPC